MTKRPLVTALVVALLGAAPLLSAQTITAPGLKAPGSISYDAEGVPTVLAASDEDAGYLLGYGHARDRFFQMDYLRRVGSGTYAELVGAAALANDVQLRTLGIRRSAWDTYAATNPKLRGIVQAYANGVNAWLRSNPLPVEYTALELTRAEPWSPVDTFVVAKLLAFQLGFDDDTGLTVRLGAYQQAGVAAGFDGNKLFFDDLTRAKPVDGRITVPGFLAGIGVTEADKSVSDTSEIPMIDAQTLEAANQHVEAIQDNPWLAPTLQVNKKRGGSNWWVIAGSKTTDGKPLIANDPHLSMDMPALWNEAHIVSTDPQFPQPMDVVGVSVPGTPNVLLGCTTRHCWGQTVNPIDMSDAFSEKFRLNTYGLPTHTIHSGVAEPVVWIFQSYFANTVGDRVNDNIARVPSIGYTNGGVTIIVPRRNNGPVVSITGDTGISFAYTGWGATQELEAYRRISRATSLAEFREALTYFDGASQNFAYADIEGNIAYTAPGEVPLRTDLQTLGRADGGVPPFVVRDGTGALKHDWLPRTTSQANQATPFELLPIAEMPNATNPASGYIANSNNDPVGTTLDNNSLNQTRPGGGIYYLNSGYADFRMGRIDRLIKAKLDANVKISFADMRQWQANNQPLDAELLRPALLTAFANAGASGAWPQLAALGVDPAIVEAVTRIRDWNLTTPTGIREGYDPGDNPANLPEPTAAEVSNSVATTLYTVWRTHTVRNVIDATLGRVGLGSRLPGNEESLRAIKNLLDTFPTARGKGASGLDFFVVAGAPSPEAARDYLLLKSLKDGLTLLASAEFAPAYAQSTNQNDYRWGKLHRKVFRHPLGEPFNIPGNNPFPITNLGPNLPGVARPGNYEVLDDSDSGVRANTLNGFMFNSGPVRRFVGSMGTTIEAQQIYPGGQSGSLLSPAYISQLPRWLVNAYKPLVIGRDAAVAGEVSRINFTP